MYIYRICFIHSSVCGPLGCFHTLAMWIILQWTWVFRCLWDSAFNSCGYTLRSDIAGLYGSYILNFLRNRNALCQQLHSFTVLPTVCKSSYFSISSSELLFSVLGVLFCFLESCVLIFMRWYVIVGYLQGYFPDDKWCWPSFHMFVDHLYIFFG